MANKTLYARLQNKTDLIATWSAATTFVPLKGEFIVGLAQNPAEGKIPASQKFVMKIGDGIHTFAELPTFKPVEDINIDDNYTDSTSQKALTFVSDISVSGKTVSYTKKTVNIPDVTSSTTTDGTGDNYVTSVTVDPTNKHKINVKTKTLTIPDVTVQDTQTGDFVSGVTVDTTDKHKIILARGTLPELAKGTTTGNGNAVTDITVNDHTITLTKGATYMTESDVETKISELGTVLKFKAVVSAKPTDLSTYDPGDVVIVSNGGGQDDGKEFVIYLNDKDQKAIEELGDPSGVTVLQQWRAGLTDETKTAATGKYISSVTTSDGEIKSIGETNLVADDAVDTSKYVNGIEVSNGSVKTKRVPILGTKVAADTGKYISAIKVTNGSIEVEDSALPTTPTMDEVGQGTAANYWVINCGTSSTIV